MKTIFGFALYFSVYSFHAEMIVSFSEDVMKSGCALQYTMWSGVKLPVSGLNASSPAAKPITSLLQTKCTVDGSPLSALRTGAADTAASVSNGTSEKSGRRIMTASSLSITLSTTVSSSATVSAAKNIPWFARKSTFAPRENCFLYASSFSRQSDASV